MVVTFWGVRGTLPVPGEQTLRYGGNTSCLSVAIDDQVLILDAGSGIRPLGTTLVGTEQTIYILLTHLHADHLLGFPFFPPLFEPERHVHVLDYTYDGLTWSLLQMFDGFHMPLRHTELPARPLRVEGDVLAYLRARGLHVARLPVNHPGGGYGYRVEHNGRTFVHMPDNELRPPRPGVTSFEAFTAFCAGADVLCHDAQYLTSDMPGKRGWGHSLLQDVCDLARAARVGELLLFHHDPARTDAHLDAVQAEAQALLAPDGIPCRVAFEGLTLHL